MDTADAILLSRALDRWQRKCERLEQQVKELEAQIRELTPPRRRVIDVGKAITDSEKFCVTHLFTEEPES